ncbi:bifunctional precorrin-2 dehydrogenase/sirohydrochlorin ferrochelatase [Sphingobacterium spiritivorum]|uniref:precorrin-2 dehydrogenase n=1 Tax=Sphingobacterium spiritivorum ATCC 33861 TaxID=525373 RepID=D7VRW9_SPHSI|nr:bifunctional precorrin-2 dehydrogenase/sirohydrochlorin ferrochelatase [Sphingobacterium spiritivorum]EFK56520.1 siroheme synthase domain protein [Sphingobacterium spiritivorum ATCC 33861]QQT35415.1 bifunctional precorrin-2 dehydrogenase/sirohydrochlorin ferrochelatase [Sphingobacterium spiritivorum]WQD32102.1 bifunctional precorrin-2 dehydrogenase/sirohydrochlorin ferrochelatase [Sphingobacterium spiritivorum]SUJ05822.1 Siroheme synthase [Sphingobacterium spiritivorum]
MNTLFPIFIKLNQIRTLLVGGGAVALEKFQALTAQDSQVQLTIVGKEIKTELKSLAAAYPHVELFEREFVAADLQDKELVISATNNPELNEEIRVLTQQQNILLNAADKPALCDFYLGSIVQKGNLKVAISTNGKSPTIAKRVKDLLQDLLPEEIDETLELMSQLRDKLKGDFEYKVKTLNEHTKSLIEQDGY